MELKLNQIWIGSFKLRVNVAKFGRRDNENVGNPNAKKGWSEGGNTRCKISHLGSRAMYQSKLSYAEVLRSQKNGQQKIMTRIPSSGRMEGIRGFSLEAEPQ
ncbi:hypothetical protein Ancab_004981 [Ancistrocladus abbreviatus]